MNTQDDRVYTSVTVRRCDVSASRLLCACTRPTFSHNVIMPVAVSKRGCTQLVVVKPGTYYRDKLLMELLPALWSIADEIYIVQQNTVPARHARQSVELIRHETPEFPAADVWPAVGEATEQWRKRLDPSVRAHFIFRTLANIACRVFRDCFKHVRSVTFLRSSYCRNKTFEFHKVV